MPDTAAAKCNFVRRNALRITNYVTLRNYTVARMRVRNPYRDITHYITSHNYIVARIRVGLYPSYLLYPYPPYPFRA